MIWPTTDDKAFFKFLSCFMFSSGLGSGQYDNSTKETRDSVWSQTCFVEEETDPDMETHYFSFIHSFCTIPLSLLETSSFLYFLTE